MKIHTLISGSKGNCTLINARNKNILIDCGASYTRIKQQLNEVGYGFGDVDCVFVTHAHTDHIAALPTAKQKNPKLEIFVQRQGADELYERTGIRAKTFERDFCLGAITVETYRCHHDAACCTGYKVCDGEATAVYVTDTGCVDEQLIEFVGGADYLVLESNHDFEMLKNGRYTPMLKKRIAGSNGHLSNEQAAYLIERVSLVGVREIILAHLSENNNLPELAYKSAKSALDKCGYGDKIKLLVAEQWKICE